jgi:hypothetical protein
MLNLDRPRDHDVHTMCDFAELLCLTSPDKILGRDTIADQIHDLGESQISDEMLDDCFGQIAWRIAAFGQPYPFVLDQHHRTLALAGELSDSQKLYLLLLLCANLAFLSEQRTAIGELSRTFERVAFAALLRMWPQGGVVRAFGQKDSEYSGKKWQRINQLAEDMGGIGCCTEQTFRGRDVGDGGIDLVAWVELDQHERRNIFSALAQCACSRNDWPDKQMQISTGRLIGVMHASHGWNRIMFIPQSFRDNHGKWAVPGDVADVILVDRLRILDQLDHGVDWQSINAPQIFEQILCETRDLV